MRKISLVIFGLAAACNRTPEAGSEHEKAATTASVAADNTQKNERDREPAAVTPGDQLENEADRSITQRVRQEVVKQDALSMAAKNVKIITANGVVTLRGPVESAAEKTEIGRIVQTTNGVTRIDNQLEVAAK